ncbi:MAG: adenylyl-sulfate reductase subunit alpha [Peptococcaceae bacterium]|jgi:adenylylsulfate reductase subunit A|nr:adenylyl-sulfate reductase subunit alpha [Peptococcaceae bacterium]
MKKELDVIYLTTDFLIIGGGAAGCYAALTLSRESGYSALIAEKAHIKRSGCLAAGVNAINAYIVPGRTPEDYAAYAKKDAEGIVREDLLLTMAQGVNQTVAQLEAWGLVILKDEQGRYVTRGDRNIKINGENIKPILAAAVAQEKQITVLNQVNILNYIVKDNRVYGAYGIGVEDYAFYVISAKTVLCATGGAAGLYKPNNPGFSRHKMWYSPFNTGAGLAMGIRAGAEMTTLEMRFVALRCKDTIAPTGTIAQGVGAKQINALGEIYEQKYGLTTSQRMYGTTRENQEGRGPCYLQTKGLTPEQDNELKKAYLNMAPSQTLKWLESGKNPSEQNVEIEGTEPYITGGHTASGYWVSTDRETTVRGLFAAGDAAGGCPQKYVSGAFAEGEIAARAAKNQMDSLSGCNPTSLPESLAVARQKQALEAILNREPPLFRTEDLEEAMQQIMDTYAGGISASYRFTVSQLDAAAEKIGQLEILSHDLQARDMRELVFVCELKERLTLCASLIAHLRARRETRWPGFAENSDYPQKDDAWLKYVNSKQINGRLAVFCRDLVPQGERYEHQDR